MYFYECLIVSVFTFFIKDAFLAFCFLSEKFKVQYKSSLSAYSLNIYLFFSIKLIQSTYNG